MTAPKPRPKELVIYHAHPGLRILQISVTTPDAREWIEREAPQFGELRADSLTPDGFTFFISMTYNPTEVAAYLNNYNEETS